MRFTLLFFSTIIFYSCISIESVTIQQTEDIGWTAYEPSQDSRVIYVSSSTGNDKNDGLTETSPVKTIVRGAELVRDGENDFLLLHRGDTWRDESLYRFKSGKDAAHPLVIASYGTSDKLPRIELDGYFINHNGKARNYVAIMDLEFVYYPKVPTDPEFSGTGKGGLRYVGGGTEFLIEGCRFTYCELIIQSYGGYHYDKVTIRRNVIEKSYHRDTSNRNSSHRPSGLYAHHVDNLLIEENVFDHNGWNEDVETADASMFNHNMYLSECDSLIVRKNIITRASSMGIKLRSDGTDGSKGTVISDNVIADGEIGLSIGGNSHESRRFEDVLIKGNVFSQIGLSNPTNRNFSWYLDVQDNAQTMIRDNYFLNQPWYDNSFGIIMQGDSQQGVTILNNMFYGIRRQSLYMQLGRDWSDISISANTFISPDFSFPLVYVRDGAVESISFSDNRYFSIDSSNMFTTRNTGHNDEHPTMRSLDEWMAISGENGGKRTNPDYRDPERTLGSYAGTLGLESNMLAFIEEARLQNRLNWRVEYTAARIKEYIINGFTE